MSPKARNWILIVTVLGSIVLLRLTTSRPIEPSAYFDAPKPMVIAHRGGSALRPGNTLAAFEHALALGVDVLEMDIRISADGVPMVIHDPTVDRTTNGRGAVDALTLAELKTLDAGYHWPFDGKPRYRGQGLRIPTLEEVIAEFPRARLNVELKDTGGRAGERVCAGVVAGQATDRVLVASFNDDTLADFRRACPSAATAATQREVFWFYLHQWLRLERLYDPLAQALQLPPEVRGISLTDPRLFAAAAARGMHVDIWTVNDRGGMQRLVDARVGGIITDRPDLLLDVLGRTRPY